MMKPKPKKRNASARTLTSALFRQRKRPSKKLYRRRARTQNASLRDQAGVLVYVAGQCAPGDFVAAAWEPELLVPT